MLNLSKQLEGEAVQILREAFSQCQRIGLLFSGGKDSTVLLHLCRKALFPFATRLDLIHTDTGFSFPEVSDFVKNKAEMNGHRLKVYKFSDYYTKDSLVHLTKEQLHTQLLGKVVEEQSYQALIDGGRRDEDSIKARQQVFSRRSQAGDGISNVVNPEICPHWSSLLGHGDHFRIYPLSNWTERDIWRYIAEEKINVVPLYFAHRRKCIRTIDDRLLTFATGNITGPCEVLDTKVRFRSLGDMENSIALVSEAMTPAEVMVENIKLTTREHIPYGTRKYRQPAAESKNLDSNVVDFNSTRRSAKAVVGETMPKPITRSR